MDLWRRMQSSSSLMTTSASTSGPSWPVASSSSSVSIFVFQSLVLLISFLLAVLPIAISGLSTLYNPFYNVYKAASSYDHGYGRSDYEEYDDEAYDKWDSGFRRRRRGPGKRSRVGIRTNI